jgi:hypothetical protein
VVKHGELTLAAQNRRGGQTGRGYRPDVLREFTDISLGEDLDALRKCLTESAIALRVKMSASPLLANLAHYLPRPTRGTNGAALAS